jgi:hypothetical protein
MKLKDCRETFYEFSGKLSDNARKLAFAGIAIVWIFKQGENGLYSIPGALRTAMLMFVVSLSLDLLQYIYQTIVWGSFHTYKENPLKHDENADFLAPTTFNNVANVIFWSKVIALVIGYVFMLSFLL